MVYPKPVTTAAIMNGRAWCCLAMITPRTAAKATATISVAWACEVRDSIHHDGWGAYPNPQGYTEEKVHVPFESAFVRLDPSGKLYVATGGASQGQGMETIFAQIAADMWKVAPDDVVVPWTQECKWSDQSAGADASDNLELGPISVDAPAGQ